jgi:hypothetical protein
MTTLKRNKPLQILLGVLFASLLLFAGYLLGETITFPETDFWNIAEPIILVAYLLVYMAFLSLIAIFSKSYDMAFCIIRHLLFALQVYYLLSWTEI